MARYALRHSGEPGEGEQAEEEEVKEDALELKCHQNHPGAVEKRRNWRETRRGVRYGPKR
jgi:hypothetical protein